MQYKLFYNYIILNKIFLFYIKEIKITHYHKAYRKNDCIN